MTDMDKIGYDDLCADLASAIEQWGARFVFTEFAQRFPTHAQELATQIIHNKDKKIPALFQEVKMQ